jgi:prolipoprotein diacylglyceryl transferase
MPQVLPQGIPSPPTEWQSFNISAWLETTFGLDLPITVRITAYALCILAGIIAATILTNRRLTNRGAEPWIVIDVIIWAIPLGLVGARAWHVATHLDDYFFPGNEPWALFVDGGLNPTSVWAIWSGGNALFGSLIGGALGAYIGCRVAGIRFWSFADALAPGMLLAQAIGRLGNYFNQELYGLPTDLPWGLQIDAGNAGFPVGLPPETLFHPTFLYEMIWNVVGIVFLLSMERRYRLVQRTIQGVKLPMAVGDPVRRLQWGKVWALYMIWYGVGRVVFESIRIDPSEIILGLRSNVWGALIAIALGCILFYVQSKNHPGVEPGMYVAGREWAPEGVVDSEETYPDSDDAEEDAAVSAPRSSR